MLPSGPCRKIDTINGIDRLKWLLGRQCVSLGTTDIVNLILTRFSYLKDLHLLFTQSVIDRHHPVNSLSRSSTLLECSSGGSIGDLAIH